MVAYGVPVGAMSFGNRPDAQTLEVAAEVDGKVLDAGTYKVSPALQMTTVFERVDPDPYVIQSCKAET